MQFSNSQWRAPKGDAPRNKNAPVFCVGWRAFVNCPPAADDSAGAVSMTDATGVPIPSDLADGQEVEIVSWRPRSRASAIYQIRRSADGKEGWIGVENLRRLRKAPPSGASTARTTD
jgi:hypothetical protein